MKRLMLLMLTIAVMASAQASLLWKITSPTTDKVSYIFGTHHLAGENVLSSYKMIDSLINTCDAMITEISSDELTQPDQMIIARYMTAPSDSTLSKVLSAEALSMVDSVLQHYGMGSAANMEYMKPATLSTLLASVPILDAMPELARVTPIDLVLMGRGIAAGKKMIALETMEQQLATLYGASIREQAAELEEMLMSSKDLSEDARKLYNIYMSGDIEGLYALGINGTSAEQAKRLITNRNNAWMSFLLGFLPTASVMVVVGAGHLGGSDGLITSLRAEGYTVTPIQTPTI